MLKWDWFCSLLFASVSAEGVAVKLVLILPIVASVGGLVVKMKLVLPPLEVLQGK